MLPAHRRIRRSEEFRSVLRTGARASTRTMVVHLGQLPTPGVRASQHLGSAVPAPDPCRAGFIVGRSVGGSVIRTRVTRRLRHLVAPHLADLPAGMGLVVRALPAAADATTEDLARDLAAGLRRCVRGVVGHQHVTPGVMSQ